MQPSQLPLIILSLEEAGLHPERSCVLDEMLLRLILHTLEDLEQREEMTKK